jgi:hypothetical protein
VATAKAENLVLHGSDAPRARSDRRPAPFGGLRHGGVLVGLAITGYVLLCAVLLLRNMYFGVAAAALPGGIVCLVQTRRVATAILSSQATVAWLLVIAAAPPWQSASVTEIGTVGVSAGTNGAKLVLTVLAFGLAFWGRVPRMRYAWPVKMLLGYSAVATLGGLTGPEPPSSLLRVARFAAIVLTVTWVTTRLTRPRLAALVVQFSIIIALGALVGRAIGRGASVGGRLGGYLPPLNPNVLGVLVAVGLLCAIALVARRELRMKTFSLVVPVLGATLVLTESRTSMIGFVAGLVALAAPRLRWRGGPVIVGLLVAVFLLAAFIQTDTQWRPLTALLTHNESTSATATLGTRVSEWSAVSIRNNTVVKRTVGQGLAVKSVEVNLAAAKNAPVDGTWSAAYLSAGLVGAILLASALLAALWAGVYGRDRLAVPIMVFLLFISLTDDVGSDVTIALVIFLSVGVSALTPRRARTLSATAASGASETVAESLSA